LGATPSSVSGGAVARSRGGTATPPTAAVLPMQVLRPASTSPAQTAFAETAV